jgi:ubiquitin C-terminal hydrolase
MTSHPGIQNLGNTSTLSACLQCLLHSEKLSIYFLEDRHVPELNRQNPLGCKGELALAFVDLLQLSKKSSSPVDVRALKTVISQYAPQFAGYQNHDAHELLMFLLDALHEDLNRVRAKPYVPIEKEVEIISDDEKARKSLVRHRLRNDSIVDDLFGGQLKSCLRCCVCKKVCIVALHFSS